MRILTAEEVEREVHDINTRAWPLSTVIFMKNLYAKHPPHIGALVRRDGVIEPNVRYGEGKFIPYESIKALVEAGWVAD